MMVAAFHPEMVQHNAMNEKIMGFEKNA